MVEHRVQHDTHISPVCLVQQETQRIIASEQRVHPVVILGVIPMVRRGLENGVEIDRRYSEVLEIVKMLDDPHEIPTLEPMHRGRALPRLEIGRFRERETPREAIGKNLVEDRVMDPLGRKGLITRYHGRSALHVLPFLSVVHSARILPVSRAYINMWREMRAE